MIRFDKVTKQLGGHNVLDELSFEIKKALTLTAGEVSARQEEAKVGKPDAKETAKQVSEGKGS